MDKKQLSQLAGSFVVSCKDAAKKSKIQNYTSPIILTTLVVLQALQVSPMKDPGGWFK